VVQYTTTVKHNSVKERFVSFIELFSDTQSGQIAAIKMLINRQRLEGFLRRGRRYGLYPADQPTIVQLIEEADETLFNHIRYNPLHILHPLQPKQIDYC